MSSSKSKENTGLGAGMGAFYVTGKRRTKAEAVKPKTVKPKAVKPEAAKPEAAKSEAVKPEAAKSETDKSETTKSDKMRTTIMLSPDAVAGIETLRAQARRDGSRLTTSQIIESALRDLLRARKINI